MFEVSAHVAVVVAEPMLEAVVGWRIGAGFTILFCLLFVTGGSVLTLTFCDGVEYFLDPVEPIVGDGRGGRR